MNLHQKVGTHSTPDLDRETYYHAKFKGFDKFAKCIELEEKEMAAKLKEQKKPSANSFTLSPRLAGSSTTTASRKRTRSSEKAADYMRSQFLLNANLGAPRKLSDFDIQTILEKYGKKASADAPPKDVLEYIPLAARLSGMEDPFQESWEEAVAQYKKKSVYGLFDTFDIFCRPTLF